jgi:hypothetical protein
VFEVSGNSVFAAIALRYRRREVIVGTGDVAVPNALRVQDPLADVNRGGKRHAVPSEIVLEFSWRDLR